MPCHVRVPFSCGRACGRTLTCGNHSCSLECHAVTFDPKREKTEVYHQSFMSLISVSLFRVSVTCVCLCVQAGKECEQCEEGCSKPRPTGCPHPCALPCHRGVCPPCTQMIRQRCHCKMSILYIECL